MAYSPEERRAYSKAWREANKEKIKAYLEANKEKVKAREKVYRNANKEKARERQKKYSATEKGKASAKACREKNRDKELARKKAYREANKEKLIEQNRLYREANREVMLERQRVRREKKKQEKLEYYEANKERIEKEKAEKKAERIRVEKEKARARYYANREADLLRKKEWERNNPEKRKITKAKNRHNRRVQCGSYCISSERIQHLLKIQKNRCCYCGAKFTKIGYHVDHIIPLALGGPNTDDNIQLLCPTCNLKKGAKDPIQYRQSQGFLL